MPVLSTIHRMTAYMAWADNVMLRNAERISDAELMEPRDALFNSIAGTFDHILVVAEIFSAHLGGRENPHRARRRRELLPFSEIAYRLREIDRRYVVKAKQWTDSEVKESTNFVYVDGGEGAMTREDILLHLVNHATYHRGFVSTLLYPIIGDSAASDLTVFLRDVWPDVSRAVSDDAA